MELKTNSYYYVILWTLGIALKYFWTCFVLSQNQELDAEEKERKHKILNEHTQHR